MKTLSRLLRDEQAATAIEYCVMMSLVLMAVIVTVAAVGAGTGGMFAGANSQLQTTNFGK